MAPNDKKVEEYCAFCNSRATNRIEDTKTPICDACKEVYEAGQASPNSTIVPIESDSRE